MKFIGSAKNVTAWTILAVIAYLLIVIFGSNINPFRGSTNNADTVKVFPTFTSTPYRSVSPTKKVVKKGSATAQVKKEPAMAQVSVENANIRGGPGTNYTKLGQASKGEEFEVTGKNPGLGDWWQIDYKGQTGWIYSSIVNTSNPESVQVALVIPAPPPSASTAKPVARATVTDSAGNSRPTPGPARVTVSKPATTQRCTFAGTEPRVPDPVGLAVYDCDAWGLAYGIVFMDRPEVTLSGFDSSIRVEMTHMAFNYLRKAALNCSSTPAQVAALAMVSGQTIEERGSPALGDYYDMPRFATLVLLESSSGTYTQCAALVAGFLDGLLG